MAKWDAIVVGAGPNGLTAACALAGEGWSVLVLEAEDRPGGGVRSEALTIDGFVHDPCAAIHPMGAASPAFEALGLERRGLEWAHPEIAVVHAFPDGTGAAIHRDFEATCRALGDDGEGYRRLLGPLVERTDDVLDVIWSGRPRHPSTAARFAVRAMRPALDLGRSFFRGEGARAILAGLSAHALSPQRFASSSFALAMLVAGHDGGWPVARGGSQSITDALVRCLESRGGELRTGARVTSLRDVEDGEIVLFDLVPQRFLEIAGDDLPPRYRRALARYRHGCGVFKMDWALAGPVPWKSELARSAGTVHLAASVDELARSERAVERGAEPDRPLVILAQPTLADPSRAPDGRHVLWGYCHVPYGSAADVSDRIEAQIERCAPGFADLVLARSAMGPAELELHDANFVGGDIGGGANDALQLLARPVLRAIPYSTPHPRLWLCSSSTPPGGGVHGMCGWNAAHAVLAAHAASARKHAPALEPTPTT